MLSGETVAVYCENHTQHKYTVWAECRDFIYKNSVRTAQETHYVSTTETNRLMLFGETVAVYCENHTEHINTLCGQNAELWCVKAGVTYINHWALSGFILCHCALVD
jgi:hypothetical protein